MHGKEGPVHLVHNVTTSKPTLEEQNMREFTHEMMVRSTHPRCSSFTSKYERILEHPRFSSGKLESQPFADSGTFSKILQ